MYIYVCIYIYIYLYVYISVVTDEELSPKLALSEGGSRENIESYLRMGFELDNCNHLVMA